MRLLQELWLVEIIQLKTISEPEMIWLLRFRLREKHTLNYLNTMQKLMAYKEITLVPESMLNGAVVFAFVSKYLWRKRLPIHAECRSKEYLQFCKLAQTQKCTHVDQSERVGGQVPKLELEHNNSNMHRIAWQCSQVAESSKITALDRWDLVVVEVSMSDGWAQQENDDKALLWLTRKSNCRVQ